MAGLSFGFGGDTDVSYEELRRKQEHAQGMLQRGANARPRNFWEGANSAANSVFGALLQKRMGEKETEGREGATSVFQDLFAQRYGGATQTPAAQTDTPTGFDANTGGNDPYQTFNASLSHTESGGNYNVTNDEGFGGKYQFGQPRLDDFNNEMGTRYQVADLTAGSPEAAALTEAVQRWHIGDIDNFSTQNGLDQYVGQNVGGVGITQDGIRAMAHLGGNGGMRRFLQSGGQYNPADSNGTSLADYARTHAGGGQQGGQAPQGGQADLAPLMQAMTNPYMSQQQQSVLGMLLQQRIAANAPVSQMDQLQMERLRLQNDALRNPVADPVRGVEFGGNLVDPTTGDVIAEGGPETPKPTTQMQNYQYYADQETAAGREPLSVNEWNLQSRQAGAPTTNVNVGGGETESEFQKYTGRQHAEEVGGIASAGATAQRNLAQIGQLSGLLGNAQQGAKGSFVAMVGRMGYKMEGASELEAATALINQLVPAQRPPGSGTMSDADLALFKSSLPQIMNSPDGNAKIISTMQAIAEYDVQRGQIGRQMQLGQISREQGFAQFNELQNPLADFARGMRGAPADAGGPQTRQVTGQDSVGDVPSGIDPADWEFYTNEEKALFQ